MAVTEAVVEKVNLQKESVCLSLTLGSLRTRKGISSSAVQSDADPSMLHVSKDILESDELDAINKLNHEIRNYLYARCLPSPFRHGVYLLPVSLIEGVLAKLDEYKAEQRELVEVFLKVYRKQAEAAEARLGSLYSPTDYPHEDKVIRAFTFSVQLWELGTPGALKAIDRQLYERELAKMNNVWEEAKATITTVLLEEFKGLTDRLADRLAPTEDGKPKVFRDTVISNMTEWLDLFAARALTDDEGLKALVEKARGLINGVEVKDLRQMEDLRTTIGSQFADLSSELEKAIVDRPNRKINLSDD